MEGLDEHEDTRGYEEDTGEAEPVETGKDIQEIEASNPHNNSECGIKIDYDRDGDILNCKTVVDQDWSEDMLEKVNTDLDEQSSEVE